MKKEKKKIPPEWKLTIPLKRQEKTSLPDILMTKEEWENKNDIDRILWQILIFIASAWCLGAVFAYSLRPVQLFVTPWTAAHQASLSSTISWSLLKLMSIELVIHSNHLILYPLLLLPSIVHSIRVFSNDLALHIRWPKYWSFRSSISPSNEYSGLVSFRIDWFDLLAVQGTLKSLLQHHSSKA